MRIVGRRKYMHCGVCGRDNPAGFKFCQYCGGILAAPIDLRDPRLEGPRQEVVRAVQDRSRTDKRLSVLWVVAVILLLVGSVIVAAVTMALTWDTSLLDETDIDWDAYLWVQSISSVASIISTVVMAVLVYYLVKRQNDHYNREARLRSALAGLLRAAAWSPERMADITPETMAISMVERRQEKERNVWFWVFVILLPTILSVLGTMVLYLIVVGTSFEDDSTFGSILAFLAVFGLLALASLVLWLYLLYFLTQTMQEHDSRWNLFAYNTRRALSKLGFPAGREYRVNALPKRSMALYIILTLITGIFYLVWLYFLVKDPNDHFEYQWEFEDNILSSISPVEGQPTSWASRP